MTSPEPVRRVRVKEQKQKMAAIAEPQIVQIADGVWAQVEEAKSLALPRHLSTSAHDGRVRFCPCRPLLESLRSTRVFEYKTLGTRRACVEMQHDRQPMIEGIYQGRELRLLICGYCGGVEVRDISLDFVMDEDPISGRRLFLTPMARARRKDDVLGWYAGRRIAGRIYL